MGTILPVPLANIEIVAKELIVAELLVFKAFCLLFKKSWLRF
jgi:hypothetical protein